MALQPEAGRATTFKKQNTDLADRISGKAEGRPEVENTTESSREVNPGRITETATHTGADPLGKETVEAATAYHSKNPGILIRSMSPGNTGNHRNGEVREGNP